MKKRPQGFNSWIEFHDWVKTNHPELMKATTIMFMEYGVEGEGDNEIYKVSMSYVERQCWKEVNKLRPSEEDVLEITYNVHKNLGNSQSIEKCLLYLHQTSKYTQR